MKDSRFLFPAALLIAMIVGAGAASSGWIVLPERDASRFEPPVSGLASPLMATEAVTTQEFEAPGFSSRGELLPPGMLASSSFQIGPISEPAAQVPEPASMALFGIGITGLITLRRFRKYFS